MIRTGAVLIAAAAAVSLAACGSSGGSAASSPAAPPATTQSSAPVSSASSTAASSASSTTASTAAGTASSGAAFCTGLQPHDEGPADAFLLIATYSPSEASKQAKSQLALMAGVRTPPPAIAADWSAWRSYLSLVLKVSKKPGAAASMATTLNGPTTKVEGGRKRLQSYAFAHCK